MAGCCHQRGVSDLLRAAQPTRRWAVICRLPCRDYKIRKGYIVKKLTLPLFFSLAVLLVVTGCSGVAPKGGVNRERKMEPIQCIVVMPVQTLADDDLSAEESGALEKGAVYSTGVMTTLLANNPKVRLLTENDSPSFSAGVRRGRLGVLSAIGENMGCDAVLLTSLKRFHQRQGTGMAVEEPASAAFEMSLIQVPSGSVLWTGDYRETQESFLANIFSSKMGSRGFRWVTVEELVRQGMTERLTGCPYLQQGALNN